MVERFLISYPWIAAVVWAVLYASDYHLTLLGQSYLRRQTVFEIEGSYELNPSFQDAIDNERQLSWLWLIWTVFGAAVLLMTGLFAGHDIIIRIWYLILVGVLLTRELAIHMRHADNILSYRQFGSPEPGVTGHIYLHRWAIYRRSSIQFWLLAGFTLILSVLSSSYILLGGALGLAGVARRHQSYAWKFETASRDS